MPFLEGPFAFTGKLDMFSAYRMRGVDGIVVRRKGGPSGEKVKTADSFKNTRRTMSEFGGCSRHGSYVRKALLQIRHLADYNFGSDINSVMRQVQLRDGTGELGRRRITLSEHTRLLEGFSTTQKAPAFDSIVRAPIYYTLDRQQRSARIDLPELLRDINYFPQNNHAMFRLVITLGIVPDIAYDIPSKEYLPPKWYSRAYNSISTSTGWNPSLEGMKSTTLELTMKAALPPDEAWTLMLSIGIEYGAFRENGNIKEVPRFGAAKILALQGKESAAEHDDWQEEIDNGKEEAAPVAVDEAAPATTEDTLEASPAPAVRYIYTAKETGEERPAERIYSYSYSIPASGASLSEAETCAAIGRQFATAVSLLSASYKLATVSGTRDVPPLPLGTTLAPDHATAVDKPVAFQKENCGEPSYFFTGAIILDKELPEVSGNFKFNGMDARGISQ